MSTRIVTSRNWLPNLHNMDFLRLSLYFLSIIWTASANVLVGSAGSCGKISGLSPAQTHLCLIKYDHMKSMVMGAEMALAECDEQFKHERWNCSRGHGVNDSTVFQDVLPKGTKEAAFLYAISSAGVLHSIARSCAIGSIKSCECHSGSPPKDADFEKKYFWKGCNGNYVYGKSFSKGFVDIRETERNHPRLTDGLKRMLMNLHNNKAGRLAVGKLQEVKCRCHGVSGSCSMQSCYRALPDFSKVGKYLKKKHKSAIEMRFNKAGMRIVPQDRSLGRRADKRSLVYIDESPLYCEYDPATGTPGTQGRVCLPESGPEGPETCSHLCCTRGYRTKTVAKSKKCHCEFRWCCDVVCQTCHFKAKESRCI